MDKKIKMPYRIAINIHDAVIFNINRTVELEKGKKRKDII